MVSCQQEKKALDYNEVGGGIKINIYEMFYEWMNR